MKKISLLAIFILVFLLLSSPVFALTFTVTNCADSGYGSLRWAIIQTNYSAGPDLIQFSIPPSEATSEASVYWWRIKPLTSLPAITDEVTIDGTTQPTDETYNNPYGPEIEIFDVLETDDVQNCVFKGLVVDGFYIYKGGNNIIIGNYVGTNVTGESSSERGWGIHLLDSNNNKIGDGTSQGRNVISGNDINPNGGIVIEGNQWGTSNEVIGNYIGINAKGDKALPNSNGIHILDLWLCEHQIIGGTLEGYGNVISGNDNCGIYIETCPKNEIYGNYIGTDATGNSAIPNGLSGIYFKFSSRNKIGNGTALGRNVISGNGEYGIWFYTNTNNCNSNEVVGNYIGTDSDGTAALPNGWGGIGLDKANNNKVGDGTTDGRNIISGNFYSGIDILNASHNEILGNYIGLDSTGTSSLSNETDGIYLGYGATYNLIGDGTFGGGNRIWWNGLNGVRIDQSTSKFNTVTLNSIASNGALGIDLVAGANNGIASPIIDSAIYYAFSNSLFISGEAPANSVIESFISYTDHSGYGEGAAFIGSTEADALGKWEITLPTFTGVASITATATDQNGNTSEFSLNKFTSVDTYPENYFMVITTAESGAGSLRQAIIDANSYSGMAVIAFDIPTSEATQGPDYYYWSIKPTSALPAITGTVILDGTTQPTNETYNNPYGPVIEIDGANTISCDGLYLNGASNCVIKGLVINNFDEDGIAVDAGGYNTFLGNYIGTDVSGEVDLGNGGDGIHISDGSNNNIIGDGTINGRNIVSGNYEHGIEIYTTNNVVLGNYIGTNVSGTADLGNTKSGVFLGSTAQNNYIGNSTVLGRNIISGNEMFGIYIVGSNNNVQGNYIGTALDGTYDLGNTFSGIFMGSGQSNKIGDGTFAGTNRIWWNKLSGISIEGSSIRNTITVNSISSNDALGIDLRGGANEGIAYPTIEASIYNSSSGNTFVSGEALANSVIEIFISDNDLSGYGEGVTFEGSTVSNGQGKWNTTLSGVSAGDKLTATATDQNGNTSEFSLNKSVAFSTLHHFVVQAPQNAIADETFILTVEAKDESGSTTTEVVGTTTLFANNGSIAPPSIPDSEFRDDGIWTGSATLSAAGTTTIYAINTGAFGSDVVTVLNSVTTIENGTFGVTIYIPAGAASDEVSVTMFPVPLPGDPPQGYSAIGLVIWFSPNVSGFLKPITVTMQKSSDQNIFDPKVFYWTGSEWSEDGINVIEITETTITFTTTHLSVFAPFGIVMGKEVKFGPNPYDPDKDAFARFWYWLTENESTKIYIIDMSGTVIWKKDFPAGGEGGRQGENHVDWYGNTTWNTPVADGAYLYKVIQGGKVIGEGKIAIIRK